MNDSAQIWREVSTWPPAQRMALAHQILQSLHDDKPAVSTERRDALQQLIGIWKTPQPPSDEQVERWLDEERMRKHG
jgi:hypothetical protein